MNKSESIINIAKALSEFQGEVSKINKDAENPFFKSNYATLDTIVDEIRPLLAKNGLSLLQIPSGDGTNVGVKTVLLHTSGEYLEGDDLNMKPAKNDPQGIGSTITYARRYSLSAFLNLNTGDDDDGNHGSGKGGKDPEKPLSEVQIKSLYELAHRKGYTAASVLKSAIKSYNVKELYELTQVQYTAMVHGYEKLADKE